MSTEDKIVEYAGGLFWYIDDEETLTIGATQKALDQIGALESIELTDAGDEFELSDWIGELVGRNSSLEIEAPFSIIIDETNPDVLEQNSLLEDDPTGDAWLFRAHRTD